MVATIAVELDGFDHTKVAPVVIVFAVSVKSSFSHNDVFAVVIVGVEGKSAIVIFTTFETKLEHPLAMAYTE